jgi:hypothetical protein
VASVVYTVGVTFSGEDCSADWLRWLREGHVAEVLANGAQDAEIVKLDAPSPTYEVRFHFPSREVFARYEKEHAPGLRAEGLRLFPPEKGLVYRRSVGEVVFHR